MNINCVLLINVLEIHKYLENCGRNWIEIKIQKIKNSMNLNEFQDLEEIKLYYRYNFTFKIRGYRIK